VVPEEVRKFAEENGGEVVPWVLRVGYEQLNAGSERERSCVCVCVFARVCVCV